MNLQNTCGYCYCQLRANGIGIHGSIIDCQNKAKNLMGPAVWIVYRIMKGHVCCDDVPKRAITRTMLSFEANIKTDETEFFAWLLANDEKTGLLHIKNVFVALAKMLK